MTMTESFEELEEEEPRDVLRPWTGWPLLDEEPALSSAGADTTFRRAGEAFS